MKFFHISNLYIGKHLHDYSLREEDRKHIHRMTEEKGRNGGNLESEEKEDKKLLYETKNEKGAAYVGRFYKAHRKSSDCSV